MKGSTLLSVLLVAVLTLAACGGDDAAVQTAPEGSATAPSTTAPGSAAATDMDPSGTVENGVRTITITPVGDQMLFEQTEIAVQAGEQVRIVFENTATSAAMQHNVVLLNDEDAINRVGQAALEASASDYVPEDDAIIAATSLAQPGETVEVTFTAPDAPGSYVYICTFPGHYLMMQGTMHVVQASA